MQKYVLVTAAKNEELFIEMTIFSVLKQSILPEKWVIVSDGSTDSTEEIVKKYSAKHGFIKLIALKESSKRDFSSKVYAIQKAVSALEGSDYDFIGNLDADTTFTEDFYKTMMEKFNQDTELGVGGGVRHDVINGHFIKVRCPKDSVAGSGMFFRKKVFDEIGGFIPMAKGGEDTVAGIMARMNGWKVASFSDIEFLHHRRTGTASGGMIASNINHGVRDYHIGYHPLYELAKCIYRLKNKPYIIGSVLSLFGFARSAITGEQRMIPNNVVEFVRGEQLAKILRFEISKC